MTKTVILQDRDIRNKISRMAYQIYEDHFAEDRIFILGIRENGYLLAEQISNKLKEISSMEVVLGDIRIGKHKKSPEVKSGISAEEYENSCVILVDDVLHTGKTMIYAVKYILDTPVKSLKTMVMIDRNHKKFPVKADYKGLSLSTSMQDHVEMHWENNGEISVCLK